MIDYDKLQQSITLFCESFRPLIDALIKAFESLKSAAVEYNEYLEKKKKVNHLRSSWVVPMDTRVKSQVMMNKPKFVFRKVI